MSEDANWCVLGNGYCVIEFRDCCECALQNEEISICEEEDSDE